MTRKNLLLAATATIFSLLIAEVVVRFIPPDLSMLRDLVVRSQEPIGYRLRPDVRIQFTGLFESLPDPVLWETNPQGIRASDKITDQPLQRRIATFGDSESYGWGVSLSDTYQAQIEALAADVEVINFGVPGYNTTNVLHAMREQVPHFQPDVIVYLFNKNDFDLPLETTDTEFGSHLAGRLRYLWQITAAKSERLRVRKSDERMLVAVHDLKQMAELADARGIPLILVFMRNYDLERIRSHLGIDTTLDTALEAGRLLFVDGEPALRNIPRVDDHLIALSHQLLARQLCELPLICGSHARSARMAATIDEDSGAESSY
jgi:GDSL-like Lipase/Acylhydrolase family